MENYKKNAVIILPTYNEKENIGILLDAIQRQQQRINDVKLSVIVVDDLSPDGTGEFVRQYIKKTLQYIYIYIYT